MITRQQKIIFLSFTEVRYYLQFVCFISFYKLKYTIHHIDLFHTWYLRLTNWGFVTPYGAIALSPFPAPNHCLNQSWLNVNYALGTQLSEIVFETHIFSFEKTYFELSFSKVQQFCPGFDAPLLLWITMHITRVILMTSLNGNIFRVTGHLCGEFTGPRWSPRTKASGAELWCFLWSASE